MDMPNTKDLSRRDALQRLAGVALLGGVGRTLLDPALDVAAAKVRPGVQLYTVRAEMEKGVEATLARVAQIGYKECEFAGYFTRTPAQVAAALKANGLTAPSAHVGVDAIGAGWDKLLDDAATVGHQWLVVAWLPENLRGSADTYKRLAGDFNKAAAAAKKRGIRFAYHNHDFEFAPLGKTDGHTILLQECDKGLVQFELDLYWTKKAGKDPAAYVAAHRDRIAMVHVKDMAKDGNMTEVGTGTIDFQAVFNAAKGGIQHFFVEQDNAKVPFDSIATSIKAMRGYTA